MSKRKTPRSVAYKLHLRIALQAVERAERLMSCWCVKERLGFDWNEEEKARLHEAAELVTRARDIVKGLFAGRIGRHAVLEAECGDWV